MGKGKGTFEFWATRYVSFRCFLPLALHLTLSRAEYHQDAFFLSWAVFPFEKNWPGKVRAHVQLRLLPLIIFLQ